MREPALESVAGKVPSPSGWRVLESSDEAEAVELYRRNWRQTGVVLVDLIMPDLEKVTTALGGINPAVKLIISSTASPDLLPAPLRAPPHVILHKPCQTSALLDTTRAVLGRKPSPA